MKTAIACFTLLTGSSLAHCQAPATMPVVGVIASDHGQRWLLYTDLADVSNAKIYILGPDTEHRVSCCAKLIGKVDAPKDRQDFFDTGDLDAPPIQQYVFNVSIPEGSISQNRIALAVWNVGAAVPLAASKGNGYALQGTATAVVTSCLGTEGMNVYLTDQASSKPLKHYYVSYGYDVEGSDCPTK